MDPFTQSILERTHSCCSLKSEIENNITSPISSELNSTSLSEFIASITINTTIQFVINASIISFGFFLLINTCRDNMSMMCKIHSSFQFFQVHCNPFIQRCRQPGELQAFSLVDEPSVCVDFFLESFSITCVCSFQTADTATVSHFSIRTQ